MPGRVLPADRQGRRRLRARHRRRRRLPRARPQRHGLGPGHLHAARCPTRSATGARSSSPSASRAPTFVGERDSLVTKCPRSSPKTPRRTLVLGADLMATVGRALLILALAVAAVRHRRLALRRAPRHARELGRLRPPRGLRARRRCVTGRLRDPRGRVPALGLHASRPSPAHSLDDDADLLQGRRRLVLAGGLAAAVGLAAVAVVEPRAVPHAPPAARRRAVRDRRPARLRGVLRRRCSSSRRRRSARSPSRRRRASGLNPLLRHPSMMIHPPMLYSGYTLFAVPFAFAVGALVTRRVGRRSGSARRAASRSPRGSSSASGSCSAPAGPTPSSAGAATGPGTRSRTRRCCRG